MGVFQIVNNARVFSVAIVWASISTSVLLYGVLVPLLPKIVQELNGNNMQNSSQKMQVEGSNATYLSNPNTLCPTKSTSSTYDSSSRIIGVLVALQQLTQIIAAFFVGPLVDKIGYDFPSLVGYTIVIGSSAGFAFARSMTVVFILRGLQGVGSAFVNTAGLSVVSDLYRDDDRLRGVMIANVLSGMSIGVGLGPPFGSVMYEFGGKYAAFLSISGLMFVIACLQLVIRRPKIQSLQNIPNSTKEAGWVAHIRLVKDPYIMTTALIIVLGLMGSAFVETSLPLHMIKSMCFQNWMLGMVFVPIQVAVVVCTPALALLSKHTNRLVVIVSAYLLQAGSLVAYPFCRSFAELLPPGVSFGIGEAAKNAAIMPVLAYLVDARIGEAIYGSAYALADVSMSISFGVGPILSGALVPVIGFDGTMYVAAAFTLAIFIPVGFIRKFLIDSTPSEEEVKLVSG